MTDTLYFRSLSKMNNMEARRARQYILYCSVADVHSFEFKEMEC